MQRVPTYQRTSRADRNAMRGISHAAALALAVKECGVMPGGLGDTTEIEQLRAAMKGANDVRIRNTPSRRALD